MENIINYPYNPITAFDSIYTNFRYRTTNKRKENLMDEEYQNMTKNIEYIIETINAKSKITKTLADILITARLIKYILDTENKSATNEALKKEASKQENDRVYFGLEEGIRKIR